MPYEVYSSFLDQNRLEIRIAAAPPILDAILGSLVPDVFPADELEVLMTPWTLTMDDEVATRRSRRRTTPDDRRTTAP